MAIIPPIALSLYVAWYLASPLFLNTAVDEPFPTTHAAQRLSPADARRQAAVLRSGTFEGAHHNGRGNAYIFRLPDGRLILRFERFRVTNGPNLYVYLSAHSKPVNSHDLHVYGAFEVAPLKGNIGPQNYELPATLDLARYKSVAIYCRRFSVVFARARLA
jgi:hypothetical protein